MFLLRLRAMPAVSALPAFAVAFHRSGLSIQRHHALRRNFQRRFAAVNLGDLQLLAILGG
jgi:hypothetical protein